MRTLRRPRPQRRDRQPKRHSPLKALLLSAGVGFALVTGVGVIGDRISRAHDTVVASTPAPTTPAPGDGAPAGPRPSGGGEGAQTVDRVRPTASGGDEGGKGDGRGTVARRHAVAEGTARPRRTTAAGPVPFPSPDASETRALLSALRRIDPALARPRSIGRALNSCRDLVNGMDRTRVTERVRLRFDDTAAVGARQAGRILTAIEDTFCPS